MSESGLIFTLVFGTLGFSLLAVIAIRMLIIENKNKYQFLAEKKEIEYRYQQELLNTRLEVQEDLLNFVSSEIHDNVGQVLSLVKLHLYTMGQQSENDRSATLIASSSSLLDKAIEDLRNISHRQNAGTLEHIGLAEAIRKELEYVRTLKKQECELNIEGIPCPLGNDRELLLYRIVQEAVHNSVKHSRCTMLTVALKYTPERFTLQVSDNGIGFDTRESYGGIGIKHIRHRATLLKGELSIERGNPDGTYITLKLNTYETNN